MNFKGEEIITGAIAPPATSRTCRTGSAPLAADGGSITAHPVNLYRDRSGGVFQAREIALIDSFAPLIAAAAKHHCALLGQVQSRHSATRAGPHSRPSSFAVVEA